jgi:hypothetical protein
MPTLTSSSLCRFSCYDRIQILVQRCKMRNYNANQQPLVDVVDIHRNFLCNTAIYATSCDFQPFYSNSRLGILKINFIRGFWHGFPNPVSQQSRGKCLKATSSSSGRTMVLKPLIRQAGPFYIFQLTFLSCCFPAIRKRISLRYAPTPNF